MRIFFSGILFLNFLFAAYSSVGQETEIPVLRLSQAGEQYKCAGDAITFSVILQNLSGKSYTLAWQKVDGVISANETETLTLENLTAAEAGQYYCKCSVDGTDYFSDTATLVVYTYVSGLPQEQQATIGNSLILEAAGADEMEYVWTATSPHTKAGNKITFSAFQPPARDEQISLKVTNGVCTFHSSVNLHIGHIEKEVVATLSGDTERCAGEEQVYQVAITGDCAGCQLNWYRTEKAESLGEGESYTIARVSSADTGHYYCRVYDPVYDLSWYSDTLALKVKEYIPGLPVDTNAVIGEAMVLTAAEGADAYTWTAPAAYVANGNILACSRVRPEERTETVNLSVSYKGCTFAVQTNLHVVHADRHPRITLSGNEPEYCVGDSCTFGVSVEPAGNHLYNWCKVGGLSALSDRTTLRLTDLKVEQSGKYFCEVRDTLYDLKWYSDTLEIKVNLYPGASLSASTSTPCYLGEVQLTAGYRETLSGLTYRWEKEGNPLTGTTAVRKEKFTDDRAVSYKVYVSNRGCEDTAEISLTPIIPLTDLPQHVAVSIGQQVTVGNTYQEGAVYDWRMKDEYTLNETRNTVTFTATKESDTVFVTSTYQGCSLSDTALLVKSHADIQVIVKAMGYTRPCVGDSLTYTVSVSEESQYNYTWYTLEKGMVANERTFTIRQAGVQHSGRYYCKIYDELFDLTFYSDTLEVLVSEYPDLIVTANGETPANGKWNFCRGTELNLEIAEQNGAKYLWTGQAIQGEAGDRVVRVTAEDSVVYKALISRNGCIREQLLTLVPDYTEVDIPWKLYRIAGESLRVQAVGRGEDHYSWEGGLDGVAAAGTYTLTVPEGRSFIRVTAENAAGCQAKDSCELVGLPAIQYTASVNDGYVVSRRPLKLIQKDTTICARSVLELEVASTGYDGYTYQWLKLGQDGIVETGKTMRITAISNTDAGKYYCRVADLEKGDWVYSDTVEVKVAYRPVAQITAPLNGERFCGGTEMTLTGKDGLMPTVLNEYSWSGMGIKSGANATTATAIVGANGYYRFKVTRGECSDSAEVMIRPVIHLVDIPSDMILSQPVHAMNFSARAEKGGIFSWYVNGQEKVASSPVASAQLDIPGAGTVVVKMTSEGCDYYDTCRIMMRTFTPAEAYPDDGFAVSCPILRVLAKELNVCLDGDVDLGVHYLGYERYEYEWYKVGDPVNILYDSIIFPIRRIKHDQQGEYYCRAYNPDINEYIYSDTLSLTVKQGPVARISSHSNGDKVCFGEEIELWSSTDYAPSGSSVDDGVADRLEWIGEGIISGQGTQTIRAIVGTSGVYTLRAIKNDGCSSETSVSLNVSHPEVDIPYIYNLSHSQEIAFHAVCGENPKTLEWYVGGVAAATGNDVNLLLENDGLVTVKMTTDANCVTWDTCRVFVKGTTTFEGGENDGFILSRPRPLIPTEMKLMSVCPDSIVTLRVNHAAYGNYKYEWRCLGKEGIFAEGKEIRFPARSGMSGYYYCTVQDCDLSGSFPFVCSDTMRLTVKNGPVAQIIASVGGEQLPGNQICSGITVQLDASGSASNVEGEISYLWTGQYLEGVEVTGQTIGVTPGTSGIYTVRVGNGSCYDTDTFRLEVFIPTLNIPDRLQLQEPDPDYVMDVNIPEGTDVVWGFCPDGGTEQMMPGAEINLTGDGWIYAHITQNACQGIDSCRVFIKNPQTFKGGENDGFHLLESSTIVWLEPNVDSLVVCRDNTLELKAFVRGLGKYTYQWYHILGGVEIPLEGQRDSLLSIHYMDETMVGKYFCEITDIKEMGNQAIVYRTKSIKAILKEGPVALITGVDSPVACFGDQFELTGSNSNGAFSDNDLEYSWTGDVFETTGDRHIVIAHPQTSGRYVLKVYDATTKCADTAQLNFEMHSPKVKIPEQIFLNAPQLQYEVLAETEGAGDIRWYLNSRNQIKSEVNPGKIDLKQDGLLIAEWVQGTCSGFDTARVYVKMPMTYTGGDEDGFIMSLSPLQGHVEPQFPSVCRGTDLQIQLNVNAEGRFLKYRWMKVGSPVALSEEKDLVLRVNSLNDAGKYYCQIVDPAEKDMNKRSVYSDTAVVTIKNGPIATINSPVDGKLVCDGVALEIDASATESKKESVNDEYEYEWFGGVYSNTGKQYVINALPGRNARYIVKASMGECSTYDTVTLNVYRPDIYIQPVIFLAEDGVVNLGVPHQGADVVRWHVYWDDDPTTDDHPITADSISRFVNGDVKFVVERQNQETTCSGYDTCQVFVKESRSFLGGEDDGYASAGTSFIVKIPEYTDRVCVGETASFYVKVVGNEYYRYEWRKSDNNRIYSDSAFCQINPVAKADEGYYYCVVTDVNNNYSQTSQRVYLTVKERPDSRILMNNYSACYGESFEMAADQERLDKNTEYTYFWQGKGIQNHLAATTSVLAEESGKYILTVGDGDCFVMDTVALTVVKAQLRVPLVYHINKGDNLTLTATVDGAVTDALNWKVDGNPYRNMSSVTLNNITKSVDFTVQTTGVCQMERNGHIYVRDDAMYAGGDDDGYTMPNDLPHLLDQCDVLLGCNVDTAVLWVSIEPEEQLTICWEMYNDGGFKDYTPVVGRNNVTGWQTDTMRFTAIYPEDEGRYRCRIGNINGYTYSREIRLVKGGTPEITVPLSSNSVCEGKNFQVGVTVEIPQEGTKTGLKYDWYFGRDGINFAQIQPAVNYNYPVFEKKDVREADEGFYMVGVSNYCGVTYDTVFQEIWEAPYFKEQPKDQAVCIWGSIELTTTVDGGGTYGYSLWQVDVDAAGKFVKNRRCLYVGTSPSFILDPAGEIDDGYFTWYVWNECDSVRSNPFKLDVEEEIIPRFEGVDTTVCAGVDGNLILLAKDNVVNPTASLKYYWEKNGEIIVGANSQKYTISKIKREDEGEYICYAHHSCSPKPVKQYNVHTRSRAEILSIKADHDYYCEGTQAKLKVEYLSDAGDVSCAWYYNSNQPVVNGPGVVGADSSVLVLDSVTVARAGYYEVRLTNECGRISTPQVQLDVRMPARFAASGTLENQSARLCLGDTHILKVVATGMEPIVYTWMKGDQVLQSGTSSTLVLTNVGYEESGTYECYVQNTCNTQASKTQALVEVVTPKQFAVQGGGHYCANTGREVSLSGFERDVVYTLYRRSNTTETEYVKIKTVSGDTVSTPSLTFGYMEFGLYHVEAVAKGNPDCTSDMNGEIDIIRDATPEQFDFAVSDPMCQGEKAGVLTLSGSEDNRDIIYRLQRYDEYFEDWGSAGSVLYGNGSGKSWSVRAGVYRIMAKNTKSGCEVQIGSNDTIAERPYPEEYLLYAVDKDTTACYGMTSDVVLRLKDCENTTKYTLVKDGEATDRTVTGSLISWDDVKGGIYSVSAETNYGCRKEWGNVTVTDLPALDRYLLDGSIVYCEEETDQEHLIVLEGSVPGIRYDFYKENTVEPLVAAWGTGSPLVWPVNLEGDAVYYVLAVDTTEHCVLEMLNRAEIVANHLEVTTEPSMKVAASTRAELNVNIKGAMGKPVVDWQPQEMIFAVDPETYTATTVLLEHGDRYVVTVSDSVCSKEAFIDLSVTGEPLRAVIKKADCYTGLDTLFVCEGDNVSLCSYVGGGTAYHFKWSDDQTDSIPVEHKSKLNYKKTVPGFVVLNVWSDVQEEGVTVKKQATDTVWVVFHDRPQILMSGNTELTCVVPGEEAALELKSLEAGVDYQLEFKRSILGDYALVEGSEHTGCGNDTVYHILYTEESAGFYRIKATKKYGEEECMRTFNLTELRRAPQHFEMESFGATQYCADRERDSIVVKTTEAGVQYRLVRNGTTEIEQKEGTGESLFFAGNFGSELTGKNTYRVVASIDRCSDTLTGQVELTTYDRPVITGITGMTDYCVSDQNIQITIQEPIQGVQYALWGENGTKLEEEAGSTDPIVMMPGNLAVGNYYMLATSLEEGHCTDTVKGLKVVDRPQDLVLVDGKVGYCNHLEGLNNQLRFANADPMIDYELTDGLKGVPGTKTLGYFEHDQADTIRFAGLIAVPQGEDDHDYVVYAHAGNCTEQTLFTVYKYKAPLDCKLRGTTLLGCVGYDMQMGVETAENGVDYILWRETAAGIEQLDSVRGEGGHFWFGTYHEEGDYYVMARNAGGCERKLTQEYKIRPLPEFYRIFSPDDHPFYCEGEEGSIIGITGTQNGVVYRIQRREIVDGEEVWKNVLDGELMGSGSEAQVFPGYYKAGVYRIISDYCDLPMNGTLEIIELPLPEAVAVGINGKACVDSSMNIVVALPEADTKYVLCYGNQPSGLDTLSGANVAWEIAVAGDGAYTVVADKGGCRLTLEPEITPGKVVNFGELNGLVDGQCAESVHTMWLAPGEWDRQANYRLRRNDDESLVYEGVVVGDSVVFNNVPAGHGYYVVAIQLSCETEKGLFDFYGIEVPRLRKKDFVIDDCKPDGEASVVLRNLSTDYQYILEGLTSVHRIIDHTGDTTLTKLENGSYSYKAYDTKTGCYSVSIDTVIRRAVPSDSITSRLEYCEGENGVNITLSAKNFNITYMLKQADGTGIDTITSVYETFNAILPEGKYVYYRERTGLWGGCWLADTFDVKKYPLPSTALTLQVPDVLCEAGMNAVVIANSEAEVSYYLQNVRTQVNIDTITGNGGEIAFAGRKPEGDYNIVMKYKGLCPAMYYKSLHVHPVPPQAIATDSRYCADEVQGNQPLEIKGLKIAAEYVLYNTAGVALDTLYGMNSGYFEPQPAGDYFVVGTYPETGCGERVAELSVVPVVAPKIFPVSNIAGADKCGNKAVVGLRDGCEGDSVKYTLYINDYFKLEGPVTATNGVVEFNEYQEVGEYKVYAEKGDGTCGVWMDGSVIIYAQPDKARLSVAGVDCGAEGSSSLIISATNSVRNWLYYLSDGEHETERLTGVPNGTLSWEDMNGQPLRAGEYRLYAVNACDSVIPMDTIIVEPAAAPTQRHLVKTSDGVFCSGKSYACKLDGSDKGIVYSLHFGDNVWEAEGNDRDEELLLAKIANTGLCMVYATDPATGCTYFQDSISLMQDITPQPTGFKTSDTCFMEGSEVKFVVSVGRIRVPRVNYYLEVNGRFVDTLLSTGPLNKTSFKPQSELGCYFVVGRSALGYCETRQEGPCASMAPNADTKIVGGQRKEGICVGDALPIEIESSELGIQYMLKNITTDETSAMTIGTGLPLTVGKVSTAGQYVIKAFVGQCETMLEDTLTIEVKERPLLNVQHHYTYPEGGPGVELSVLPETSENVYYILANAETEEPYDSQLANGQRIDFVGGPFKAGIYEVSTLSLEGNGCEARDTITVEEIGLTHFRLEIIGTPQKCEASDCRSLRLSGSERGITYSLYQVTDRDTAFLQLVEGTDRPIDFGSRCDTGYFYVVGEKLLSDGSLCKAKMGESIHIYVSTLIEKYRLLGDTLGYCRGTEPCGKVILDGSQANNVKYQLLRNGIVVPGRELSGRDGGRLAWNKLEGRSCVENDDIGNIYTVVAVDGDCRVAMAGSVSIVETNPVSIRSQRHSFDACTGDNTGVMVDAFGCHLKYKWTHDGVEVGDAAGYAIDSMRMEDAGTYVCEVSNYCNTVYSEPINISVRRVVLLPEYMEDKLVCSDAGESVELVSKAVGENYAWFKIGSEDTVGHDRILTIPNALAERDAGDYYCVTWNECGGLADTVKLEFNRVPKLEGWSWHKDTLCVGSPYAIRFETRDSVDWYRNNTLMPGKHNKRLDINALELGHEGSYQVELINACDKRRVNLVDLFVDDTIRVITPLEENKHYCENSSIVLKIETTPIDRVSFTWQKNLITKGYGNTYTMPAIYAHEDGAWYVVTYRNKCSSGQMAQNIYIDRKIVLKNVTSPDIICADNAEKIIIIEDQAQTNRDYNQYKWYLKTESGIPALKSESDTLQLKRQVNNRGIYYAEISNTCETVQSPEIDLHIDSIPVILRQPVGGSVCEGMDVSFNLKASGGDIHYRWMLAKKDGSAPEQQVWVTEDYISESQWLLQARTIDYDSAKVWCIAENDCGYVSSDTVLMRINRNIRLTTDQEAASLCPNASDQVKIAVVPEPRLIDRWNYYLEKDGVVIENPKAVYNAYTDTVIITEPGVYRFYDLQTKDTRCVAEGSEVTVNVENRELFYATLSAVGPTTVCWKDKVSMKVHIENGKAPWKVDIRRRSDNQSAPEVGGEPITMYSRDTVLTFALYDDNTYYIAYAAQFEDPMACAGEVSGEVVFTTQRPYETRFGTIAKTRFGSCQTVDLKATFRPVPEDVEGQFYVNGVLAPDNMLSGEPGRYRITYRTETTAGCVDSAYINVTLDSLPSAYLVCDKEGVCPGEATSVYAGFKGTAPFDYRVYIYNYYPDGKLAGRPSLSQGKASDFVTYPVIFTAINETDNLSRVISRRKIELYSVKDAYGCEMIKDADDTLSIQRYIEPRFVVSGLHQDYGGNYTSEVLHFIVPNTPQKKDVYFNIEKTAGDDPWRVEIVHTSPAGLSDTLEFKRLFTNKEWKTDKSGVFKFTMSNDKCESKTVTQRMITHLDSGYVQVKVCLEGPFNKATGLMESLVFENNLVPLNNWTAWPETGERKGIDWVTVQLREGNVNGKVFHSEDYLLLNDGSIVDRQGRDTLAIPNVDFDTEYYIVVKHRNHLAVGSRIGWKLTSSSADAPVVDLRISNKIYKKEGDMSDHMIYVGIYNKLTILAMPAGNVMLNSLISVENSNMAVLNESYELDYYDLDVNLDGKIDLPAVLSVPEGNNDVVRIFNNRDRYSEIND